MSDRLFIFDTTLRDGEQVPGCQLNTVEKIQVAKALEQLGVDVIEAGFPVSSPGDFKSVVEISKAVTWPTICALTRAVEKDIDVAAESLKVAEAFRIHTFIATSPMHIATKLRSTLDEVIERAIYMVKRARNYTDDVEFSCEDAGRTPIADLARVVEAAINAGATTINIPDTVGYTMPFEFAGIISALYQGFGDQYLYPSVQAKAANLLYLVVKDHPFLDGNKRSAAALFIHFLDKNGVLRDGERLRVEGNALAAMTLMIALSDPSEKDSMVTLVENFIA